MWGALEQKTGILLLKGTWTTARLRQHLMAYRARMQAAITTITQIARPADDHFDEELLARYSTVRRYLPALLTTLTFAGVEAGSRSWRPWPFSRR